MEMRTMKFTLEVDFAIEGNSPPDDLISNGLITLLNEAMPNVVLEDGENDYVVRVYSWDYRRSKT